MGDTLYKCHWDFSGGANGGNVVGCQNDNYESIAQGNHIGCDFAAVECELNPNGSFCDLKIKQDPSRGILGANVVCKACRPCVGGQPNQARISNSPMCSTVPNLPSKYLQNHTAYAEYCVGRGEQA